MADGGGRAKQFGGHDESARMFKTKYFKCTKTFLFLLIGLE